MSIRKDRACTMTWKEDDQTVIEKYTIIMNEEYDLVVVNLMIRRTELDKITTGFVTKAKMKEFILALVPESEE
jgi:DNA-directed RNA polymerase subunit H (RpoH/RPB5)